MKGRSFSTLAGQFAIAAGILGFLYSLSFVVLKYDVLTALFLLLGGLCSLIALTGLYEQFRNGEPSYALLAFMLSAGGAAGSLIHGGYDLSNALHPPATLNTDLPNPLDPRGLLTFGVASIGIYFFSRLMSNGQFPKKLSTLGYVSAVLMLVLYLGRLIILQATSLIIVIPALLEGFLVNPIWYIWLGVVLMRENK